MNAKQQNKYVKSEIEKTSYKVNKSADYRYSFFKLYDARNEANEYLDFLCNTVFKTHIKVAN